MRIVIASGNPVKIQATEAAFRKMFPGEELELAWVSVASGVSDQPMSDEETYRGAGNRAKNARILMPEAEYWVGIEGGLEERNGSLWAFAWICGVLLT